MSRRRFAGLAAMGAALATVMSAFAALPAHAATSDPATNVAPSPNYWNTCGIYGATSSACSNAVLDAINHARSLEGVKPMVLPSGFSSLSTAVQTFVVSNLERVDRGLQPAAGMVSTLNSLSQTAATNDADPVLQSWTIGSFNANRWGSNWAGDLNALAADYDWMYNDGWGPSGSTNLDCTSSGTSGCWGHRHNILATYGGEELITGVGSVQQSQWTSIAQIFVAGSGPYPAFTTSWASITGLPASTSPSVSDHPTVSTVSATPLVYGGHTGLVSGKVVDTVTGQPLAGLTVLLCHRTAVQSTGSCVPIVTGSTGLAKASLKPSVTTTWWLTYPGGNGLAASASPSRVMTVKAGLVLSWVHMSTGYVVRAAVTPVRYQSLALQRWSTTYSRWVTIVRTTVRTSTTSFTRLHAGHYRVVVAQVTGVLANAATTYPH